MSGPDRQPSTSANGRHATGVGGPAFRAEMRRAWAILGRLNALAPGDFDAVRALLSELTGQQLDPSVRVLPPFHTDSGRNLRFGRNVFVNHGCTAMDLGGIAIGDDVMWGRMRSCSAPVIHLARRPAARRSRRLRYTSAAARGSPPAPRSCRA
jgi:acetyltransferase-like isoleucine patch superfamily enzyme